MKVLMLVIWWAAVSTSPTNPNGPHVALVSTTMDACKAAQSVLETQYAQAGQRLTVKCIPELLN
jgi:hypothetical protein